MGMQDFIRKTITIREKFEEKKVSKYPSCGRDEKTLFRNKMGTLECICGLKFYGR